jgi:hypothetical protein
MSRICLVQDKDQWWALVNTVISLPVPYNVGKLIRDKATAGFSRRNYFQGAS